MTDLKSDIKAKLSNRKDNGWKEFVKENGSSKVQLAFTELVATSLKEGKAPISKDILQALLFDGASIIEADVLMRLK
jgi:hypothetical protein